MFPESLIKPRVAKKIIDLARLSSIPTKNVIVKIVSQNDFGQFTILLYNGDKFVKELTISDIV